VPNQKTVKIGIWENGNFIGCVLWGDGANQNIGKPYGIKSIEVCELVRIALTNHRTPVTRIVRIAISFLRKHCPGIRLIVSFADPEMGHVGSVYQAGNWIYAGKTVAADEYIVNGIRMHGRALRSTRSTHRLGGIKTSNVKEWAETALNATVSTVHGSSKHRYLMPLDDEMRERIKPLAKPYPKRAKDQASGHPPELGGETPTRTLQNN
jgi:hypothetical protein